MRYRGGSFGPPFFISSRGFGNLPKVIMKRKSSPGHKGGQFELIIAAELLRQGFVVFRSLLAVGPTDLIAIKRGRMLRVQVKSETSHWKAAFKGGNDVLGVVNNGHRSIPRF